MPLTTSSILVLICLVSVAAATSVKEIPLCSPCRSSSQCASWICRHGKCVPRHTRNLRFCSAEDCSLCQTDMQCLSGSCQFHRCVPAGGSIKSCFPSPSPRPRPSKTSSPSPMPLKADCDTCSTPSECESGSCSGSPTRCNDSSDAVLRSCFKPDCSTCRVSGECGSQFCTRGKCITRGDDSSIAGCFPSPSPSPSSSPAPLKPRCASCSSGGECVDGGCSGVPLRCNGGSDAAFRRCFKVDCASCSESGECGSQFCTRGKCVTRDEDASFERCFPRSSSSPSPIPSSTVAVSPRRPDCSSCRNKIECLSGKCYRGRCGSRKAFRRCDDGEKPLCARCRRSKECESGKCWGRKCSTKKYEDLLKCGFEPECSKCRKSAHCATMKCWKRKCVFNNSSSKKKCFKGSRQSKHHRDD